MHNGSLAAWSEGSGRGATFKLTLPIAREATSAEKLSGVLERIIGESDVSGKTVLIVDDDADTLEAISLVFAEQGVIVRTALSASEARAVLATHQVGAIFSDISMPGEDGYQFISSLRANGNSVRAAAVTAFAREEDSQRAFAAGFDEHLGKPVDLARLVWTFARMTKAQETRPEK